MSEVTRVRSSTSARSAIARRRSGDDPCEREAIVMTIRPPGERR
jgi:hypothetical protein